METEQQGAFDPMPRLTFSKDQPLYIETANQLRRAIQSGALPGNSRLDSVSGLAQKFRTSRKVVENAINLLKEEGLVVSRPRQGLYVCAPGPKKVLIVSSLYSRTPESAAGEVINILSDSSDWQLEFIETEFLRHLPEENFKKRCSHFSSVLLFGQGYAGNEPEIARLKTLNIPILCAFGFPTDSPAAGFHALYSDMEEGTRMLLHHLKEQGCSTVGFLGWHDTEWGKSFRLPRKKYLELLEAAGMKKAERLFGTISLESTPGDDALADFMADWRRFDAVICYSHLSALHLYNWCQKHHIHIPGDLKVAACGMRLHSELLDPPLTAFLVDREKHLEEVMNFLKGGFPHDRTINMAIPPVLAIHASTSNSIPTKEKDSL